MNKLNKDKLIKKLKKNEVKKYLDYQKNEQKKFELKKLRRKK